MTTRKITRFTGQVLLLALVTAVGFSGSASAAPCDAEIDALKTALDGICPQIMEKKFKSKKYKSRKSDYKKCRGLNRKLDNTARKLEKGKFLHAARKLSDFGWVIEGMAMRRKPKISMDDYQALMNPYYVDVANCIASGGVSTTPVVDDSGTDTGGDDPPPITVQF